MKTIVAGSRSITDYQVLLDAIKASGFKITEVVSGCARGADTLGERYAKENNLPLHFFPAPWKTLGRIAGLVRNCEMADNAESLLALWDGQSRGTEHMITIAFNKELEVFVHKPVTKTAQSL